MEFTEAKKKDTPDIGDDEIAEQWDVLVKDAGVKRDNNGEGGALRLAISISKTKEEEEEETKAPAASPTTTALAQLAAPSAQPAAVQPLPPAPDQAHPKVLAPCKTFEDLRTFKDLLDMGEDLANCETLIEVAARATARQSFQGVVRGLFTSWKSSVNELDKALSGYKKELEASVKEATKAKAKASPSGAPAAKRKKGGGALDMCLEKGAAMITVDVQKAGWEADLSQAFVSEADVAPPGLMPFLLSGMDIKWASDPENPVGKNLAEFVADFAVSQWRDTSERAMRTSVDSEHKDIAAGEFVQRQLRGYCPRGSLLVSHLQDKSPLKAEMCLTNFSIKMGSTHVTMEKSSLWTGRLSTAGTRTVAIFNLTDIKDFLKMEGMVGKDPKVWLKEATTTSLAPFFAKGAAHFATVAPGDMLFVPANSLTLETVMDKADCFGVRWSMVCARDVLRYQCFEAVATNKMTPSTHMSKRIVELVQKAT